jgi:hypothetical protein
MVFVLILVVVALVSYIIGVLQVSPVNQKVQLTYAGALMDITGSNGDWSKIPHNYSVDLTFNTTGVLYNGEVTVTYLATNGSWVQLPTKQLGTIDIVGTGHEFMTQNCQFVAGTKYATPFYFNSNDNLNVIRIEAFGFTKP